MVLSPSSRWRTRRLSVVAGLVVGLTLGAGCDENKATTDARPDDSAGDAGEAVVRNRRIERAMGSAVTAPPPAEPGSQPPPNGLFDPPDAEKIHKLGAPATLQLFDEGSAPRVSLRPEITAGTVAPLRIAVSQKGSVLAQAGRGLQQKGDLSLPAVIYDLKLSVVAEAQLAAGAEGKKPPPAGGDAGAPVAAGPLFLVAEVAHAQLDPKRAKSESADKELKKLAGSRLISRYQPDGSIQEERIELAKDASAGVAPILRAVVEVLGVYRAPAPDKAVGAGAYWMITDRPKLGGLDVIRYRVVKVTSVEGNAASLEVDIRAYAVASATNRVKGIDPAFDALQFESLGKGTTVLPAGALAPTGGTLSYAVVGVWGQGGQPAGQLTLEGTSNVVGTATATEEPDPEEFSP